MTRSATLSNSCSLARPNRAFNSSISRSRPKCS
ncbi:hypothetical protein DSM3645_03608 [Blastopirellula marina DSM 3645]|uniref:Uncharacterized protein n=1 Tax=Blastopirellula marina DSM 3645 TaxID=314230 RepID=A3ZV43_9BACT|nr:hypothetical protein DSM3645_03608 [Blastopirellula marina DSM 3645]